MANLSDILEQLQGRYLNPHPMPWIGPGNPGPTGPGWPVNYEDYMTASGNIPQGVLQRLLDSSSAPTSSPPPAPTPSPTGTPSQDTIGPWTPEYESNMQAIQRRLAQAQRDYDISKSQAEWDYGQGSNDLNQTRDETLRRLANRMATQGMTYSGINVGEQGRVGEQYQKGVEGLSNQRQQRLTGLANRLSDVQAGGAADRSYWENWRAQQVANAEQERLQKEAQAQIAQQLAAWKPSQPQQPQQINPPAGVPTYFKALDELLGAWNSSDLSRLDRANQIVNQALQEGVDPQAWDNYQWLARQLQNLYVNQQNNPAMRAALEPDWTRRLASAYPGRPYSWKF